MANLLVIGDLHLSPSNKLGELFIDRVEKLIIKKYDGIILLGDIFHTHEKISETTLNMVIRLFEKLTSHAHLYVLVGNHDYKDGNQFLTNRHALAAFKEWKSITIVDKPKLEKIGGVYISLLPFVPKGRFKEAIDKIEWKKSSLIFCHQEFRGCKLGSIISDAEEWNGNIQIVSGHIHEKQSIGKVYYPGTPYDIGFGYEGKRVILDVTVSSKEDYSIRSIETGLPRKKTLTLSLDDAKNYTPENDFVRLIITCKREEYVNFLKSDHARNLKKYGVCIAHKSDNLDDVAELLKNRGLLKCATYRETFKNLVWQEKEYVQSLYKKILL